MTPAQKSHWKARQDDMTQRRRNFHGAVTYMFDGVFSWQMYGSADAVGERNKREREKEREDRSNLYLFTYMADDGGAPYTEYLMRCQWGSTFDNMQPWIVAHRFSEFALLDKQLKKHFPLIAPSLPSLPKKVARPCQHLTLT